MKERYWFETEVKEKYLLTNLDSQEFIEKHPQLKDKIISSDIKDYDKAILWDNHRTNTRVDIYLCEKIKLTTSTILT